MVSESRLGWKVSGDSRWAAFPIWATWPTGCTGRGVRLRLDDGVGHSLPTLSSLPHPTHQAYPVIAHSSMATPTPGAVAAPLNLTPLERPAFAALFAAADTSNSGIITGSVAVAFFARSRPALSSAVLGAIWSLADRANNGFLGKAEWAVAMRLMAHAQRGASAEALEGLLSQPGPPPAFEGVQLPGQQTPSTPSRHLTGNAQQAITISPADRARYTRIFASSGPTNGLLDGE